jgi:hypothetical protein
MSACMRPNTFTYIGTANRDRIVQYGGTANDLLSAETGAENDWIEQYGGGHIDYKRWNWR